MGKNKEKALVEEGYSHESTRRNFIKKYGKLAAITPVAVTTLMSPATSAAPKSCRGNGTKRC